VLDEHFKFHKVVYGDIIHVRWKTFIWFCRKFIHNVVYQISSELPEFCRRYY